MSQDIEIDPDSRTIKYYEKPTVESIKEHLDVGGLAIGAGQARALLDEIDRLQNESAKRNQAAMDISDENDRLRKENTSLNQSAKSLAHVNHQLQKELFDQNQVMNELFQKAERLEKLVPPESERGPGFVGQGSWSVFAEKVVAERDYLQDALNRTLAERDDARDELNTLCEDIRALKDENDELREGMRLLGNATASKKELANIQELLRENSELHRVNAGLQEEVSRCAIAIDKRELANIHYGHDEFLGIDGYGPFSLKRIDKDEWEVRMLQERVILYNKKGRRVRAHIVDGNPEGDW